MADGCELLFGRGTKIGLAVWAESILHKAARCGAAKCRPWSAMDYGSINAAGQRMGG